jgi:hypothetical protein
MSKRADNARLIYWLPDPRLAPVETLEAQRFLTAICLSPSVSCPPETVRLPVSSPPSTTHDQLSRLLPPALSSVVLAALSLHNF